MFTKIMFFFLQIDVTSHKHSKTHINVLLRVHIFSLVKPGFASVAELASERTALRALVCLSCDEPDNYNFLCLGESAIYGNKYAAYVCTH